MASCGRLDELARQLRPVFETDEILDAGDKSTRFTPWDPVIKSHRRQVKTAADWLPEAKSVLVIGLRYHSEVLRWPPSRRRKRVGP